MPLRLLTFGAALAAALVASSDANRAQVPASQVPANPVPAQTVPAQTVPAQPVPAPQMPVPIVPAPFVPAPLPPPPKPTGGIVLGQVIDSVSGRGIAHALVRIEGRNGVTTRVADDRGRFFFTRLPAGEFRLTAEKRGFLDGQYGRSRAGGEGTPLVLYDNQWMTDAQVALFRPATIAGVVVDDGNEPVIGVKVQAFKREFQSGRWHYTPSLIERTDDQGVYRISGLAAGEYVVAVPTSDAVVPVAMFENIAVTGSVTAEMSALVNMNGPLTIGLDGMPRGVVFDSDGRTMRLVGSAATPPPPDRGRHFAYPTTFHPGTDLLSRAMPITVAAGEVRSGVTFQLRPTSTSRVTGFVLSAGRAAPNQMLRLVPEGTEDFGFGFEVAATVSNDAGAFVFPSVPAGHYTIVARSPSSTQLMSGAAAPTPVNRSNADRLWGRQALTVGFDDIGNVIVPVRYGATVPGIAYADGDRRPTVEQVGLIGIGLESVDGRPTGVAEARVDTTGTFVIYGVPDGRYRVRVTSLPDGWFLKSALMEGVDVSETPVDISPRPDQPPITVTISNRTTSVLGTVRDSRGVAPAGGTTVVVFPATYKARADDGLSPRRLRTARANPFGVYRLDGLPPGDYLFAAIDEALAENWQTPESLSRLATSATRVTLTAVETRTIDVRLPASGVRR